MYFIVTFILAICLLSLRVDVEKLTKKNEDLEKKLLKLEAEILKIQETIHANDSKQHDYEQQQEYQRTKEAKLKRDLGKKP